MGGPKVEVERLALPDSSGDDGNVSTPHSLYSLRVGGHASLSLSLIQAWVKQEMPCLQFHMYASGFLPFYSWLYMLSNAALVCRIHIFYFM